MGLDDKADQLFLALNQESCKVHRVFNGSNQLTTQYEAVQTAVDGQSCLVTTYAYDGSGNLIGMKEVVGVWSSAFDI